VKQQAGRHVLPLGLDQGRQARQAADGVTRDRLEGFEGGVDVVGVENPKQFRGGGSGYEHAEQQQAAKYRAAKELWGRIDGLRQAALGGMVWAACGPVIASFVDRSRSGC
ncbi:MAG: hypothetical protein FD129_2180, partial [bacterium]